MPGPREVIEQRKKRIVQQQILKSKPASITGNTPGPGHYMTDQTHISCPAHPRSPGYRVLWHHGRRGKQCRTWCAAKTV